MMLDEIVSQTDRLDNAIVTLQLKLIANRLKVRKIVKYLKVPLSIKEQLNTIQFIQSNF